MLCQIEIPLIGSTLGIHGEQIVYNESIVPLRSTLYGQSMNQWIGDATKSRIELFSFYFVDLANTFEWEQERESAYSLVMMFKSHHKNNRQQTLHSSKIDENSMRWGEANARTDKMCTMFNLRKVLFFNLVVVDVPIEVTGKTKCFSLFVSLILLTLQTLWMYLLFSDLIFSVLSLSHFSILRQPVESVRPGAVRRCWTVVICKS